MPGQHNYGSNLSKMMINDIQVLIALEGVQSDLQMQQQSCETTVVAVYPYEPGQAAVVAQLSQLGHNSVAVKAQPQ